jgi:hypothetical protein
LGYFRTGKKTAYQGYLFGRGLWKIPLVSGYAAYRSLEFIGPLSRDGLTSFVLGERVSETVPRRLFSIPGTLGKAVIVKIYRQST